MKPIVFGILTAGTAALTLAASPAHAEECRGGYNDHGNYGREFNYRHRRMNRWERMRYVLMRERLRERW